MWAKLQGGEFRCYGYGTVLCDHGHSLQPSRNSKSIVEFTHCGTWVGMGASQHLMPLKQLQWGCIVRASSTVQRDKSINSYSRQRVVCQVQLWGKKIFWDWCSSQVQIPMEGKCKDSRMDLEEVALNTQSNPRLLLGTAKRTRKGSSQKQEVNEDRGRRGPWNMHVCPEVEEI